MALAKKSLCQNFFSMKSQLRFTERTVTCYNWFTTIPLIERMLEEPYNLTITGTIRKNKREIPAEMKVASKEFPESKFCFSDKVTLLSFTPKKNKIVLLASSFTSSIDITNDKPDIILHYNKTKGGTNTFDVCVTRIRQPDGQIGGRCEFFSAF